MHFNKIIFIVNFISLFSQFKHLVYEEGGETMSKSIVKNSLYLLFCSFLLFSFLAPNSGYALDQSEIQLQSIYINKSSCFISISGITANCTSSLNTRSSTKLSIKMELQKKKSGTYETIKTWSASKTGTYLSVAEKRAINLLADYRLKTTFTAGTETRVAYAYPS